MKYRKKPVVIEAFQWTGNSNEYPEWFSNAIKNAKAWPIGANTDEHYYMEIETLEGIHHANIGDYIIKGIAGEIYPCKPEIFEQTYEKVEESQCTD